MTQQNYINHVVFAIDASGSMGRHSRSVVKVADDLVAHLAQRSKELDQETRVTVYTFNSTPQCLIYDMDVLRLPSIASLYKVGGNTALVDASLLALEDLALTPEKYGDHAFLVYVLTDGEENASRRRGSQLTIAINQLAENWTVAALVPNASGKFEAKKFGFPTDNIAVWDTTSERGAEDAGQIIRAATDSYMVARASGTRSTRTLFSTGAAAVNKATIASVGLKPLSSKQYVLIPVIRDTPIKEFVEEARGPGSYRAGQTYYPLTKRETIQANKDVVVVEIQTARVYAGDGVRNLIGLPDVEVRVSPDFNPEYRIYVQSTSTNRKLIAGTKVMVLL